MAQGDQREPWGSRANRLKSPRRGRFSLVRGRHGCRGLNRPLRGLCAGGRFRIYTIKQGEPLVLRYRLVLHDGRPDRLLAERLAIDFVQPPKVQLKCDQ